MTAPADWRRVLPAVVGALLVVCAALVIIGVSLERRSNASCTLEATSPRTCSAAS